MICYRVQSNKKLIKIAVQLANDLAKANYVFAWEPNEDNSDIKTLLKNYGFTFVTEDTSHTTYILCSGSENSSILEQHISSIKLSENKYMAQKFEEALDTTRDDFEEAADVLDTMGINNKDLVMSLRSAAIPKLIASDYTCRPFTIVENTEENDTRKIPDTNK